MKTIMPYLTRGRGNGKSILFIIENHERLIKYCDELERALDKTCKKLEEFTIQMYDEGVCFTPCIMKNEYWRKWALNGEQLWKESEKE